MLDSMPPEFALIGGVASLATYLILEFRAADRPRR